MAGLDYFMWRTPLAWTEWVAVATAVVERWNSVTHFVIQNDPREGLWTLRHESAAQPFLVVSENSMRGTLPREGNPLPMLFLLGIALHRPGAVEISFASGQKIDAAKFVPADLLPLLPQATHAAHRKLAELIVAPAS